VIATVLVNVSRGEDLVANWCECAGMWCDVGCQKLLGNVRRNDEVTQDVGEVATVSVRKVSAV
jgi:hypothetical protein